MEENAANNTNHSFHQFHSAPNQDYLNVQESKEKAAPTYDSQFHSAKSSNAGMALLTNPKYTPDELARFMALEAANAKIVTISQQVE